MANNSNYKTHLSLEDRRIIATGIKNGSTKTSIADTLGKEKSTIGKEIKNRSVLSYKCKMPLECAVYKKCKYSRECTLECPDYVPFKCSRRDRSPGACNGCSNYIHCRFDKYSYNPEDAQREYESTLVDSRQGVNMPSTEAKEKGEIIAPLLHQGQSPYIIIKNHPELGMCEKTLYNYIEGDVFHDLYSSCFLNSKNPCFRPPKKT